MLLLFIAFIAGVLTVLAPCVLPLLPIIVGGSVSGGVNMRRAYTVSFSLGVSVIVFTLILKFSTAFIGVPQHAWEWFSGGVLIAFGIISIFPQLWDSWGFVNTISRESNKAMSAGFMKQSFWGDVVVGAALGPVFSTCSPTYFVILATVLPASFFMGLVDLLAYTSGLVLMLLLVSLVGQRVVDALGIAADPNGWFRKTIGALFIVVGLLVFTGGERAIETWLLSNVFDITTVEQKLLQFRDDKNKGLRCVDGKCNGPDATSSAPQPVDTTLPVEASTSAAVVKNVQPNTKNTASFLTSAQKAVRYPRAPEIANPDGYVNTNGKPITIGEFTGNKIVLIDFWTYSCINCQRTLPYLKAWDEKYRDDGLQIIGIHTPEFAFERVLANVQDAVNKFGLKYPSVLDNNYGTWNAFGNSYWPRKYLIDIDGYIVYDHAGEGSYDVTEKAIQAALAERAARLGTGIAHTGVSSAADVGAITDVQAGSPETYFGATRNEYLGNGKPGTSGLQVFSEPETISLNALYLIGSWNITPEYSVTSEKVGSGELGSDRIDYKYRAKAVYFVAGSATSKVIQIEAKRDGKPIDASFAGKDVVFKNGKSYVDINENRLYEIIKDSAASTHLLEFIISEPGLQAYTFTFG